MEILIDTNIILDVAQKREEYFENSYKVFERCILGKNNGYLSSHSLSDIFFIMRKSHSVAERKNTIAALCKYFTIIEESGDDYLYVAENQFMADLEDGLQIRCAENFSLDFIVTRNIKDFSSSSVKPVTPADFILLSA